MQYFFEKVVNPDCFFFFFRFSILGEHAERFLVDQDSGVVTLAGPLDREERARYHLTLVAQDSSATDPRATAVNLTITVQDANDNDPTFSDVQYIVHVPAKTSAGTRLSCICIHIQYNRNCMVKYYLRRILCPLPSRALRDLWTVPK